MAHDNSGEESEEEKQERIKRQLPIAAAAGGYVAIIRARWTPF